MQLIALLVVATLALSACGSDDESSEPKAPAEGAELTPAEAVIPTIADIAIGSWCETFEEPGAFGGYSPNAKAALRHELGIAVAAMVELTKDKPTAIYDDTYGAGRVPVQTFARQLAEDVGECRDPDGAAEDLLDAAG